MERKLIVIMIFIFRFAKHREQTVVGGVRKGSWLPVGEGEV